MTATSIIAPHFPSTSRRPCVVVEFSFHRLFCSHAVHIFYFVSTTITTTHLTANPNSSPHTIAPNVIFKLGENCFHLTNLRHFSLVRMCYCLADVLCAEITALSLRWIFWSFVLIRNRAKGNIDNNASDSCGDDDLIAWYEVKDKKKLRNTESRCDDVAWESMNVVVTEERRGEKSTKLKVTETVGWR